MRLYLNVQPAAYPVPTQAGDGIAGKIAETLKNFRILSAFDYRSFTIQGVSVYRGEDGTLDELLDQAPLHKEDFDPNLLRIILTDEALVPNDPRPDLDLLIGILPGDAYAWRAGTHTEQAWISYEADDLRQREAAILDIFIDIMIANCPSVQAVFDKFLRAEGRGQRSLADIYRLKAKYARESESFATLFEPFAPTNYASFAAMARSRFHGTSLPFELAKLKTLWLGFLETLSEYFLDADEAARLVMHGRFRDTHHFIRARRGWVSEREVRDLLANPAMVHSTGSYVLCILTKQPKPGELDEASARFGLKSPGRLKRLRLCDEKTYLEMDQLVRSGVATPIRLFLKHA